MKRKLRPAAHRARILLVEDENLLAWSIAHALKKEGLDSVIAESGEAALTALRSETFDALVTDLELPEVDGATVATVAKKALPDLPVIMISAEEGSATRQLESVHIIDHFVEKPFDIDQIVKLVKACLAERIHARTL